MRGREPAPFTKAIAVASEVLSILKWFQRYRLAVSYSAAKGFVESASAFRPESAKALLSDSHVPSGMGRREAQPPDLVVSCPSAPFLSTNRSSMVASLRAGTHLSRNRNSRKKFRCDWWIWITYNSVFITLPVTNE